MLLVILICCALGASIIWLFFYAVGKNNERADKQADRIRRIIEADREENGSLRSRL